MSYERGNEVVSLGSFWWALLVRFRISLCESHHHWFGKGEKESKNFTVHDYFLLWYYLCYFVWGFY